MKSFKQAAIETLKELGKPLHYKDITKLAIKNGLIASEGKTPWATMNAQLSMDIVKNGDNSEFIRTDPGYFYLKTLKVSLSDRVKIKDVSAKARIIKHRINKLLSTKQKGDITEARVAELITLYGDEGLSCYRPISDDEGIDIIVKRRGRLEVVYIQVKSTYGYKEDRGFVSKVKEKTIQNKTRMLMVFVYFDLTEGDLYDHVFCIPAPEFLKLTTNKKKKTTDRVFTVGLKNPDRSKYAEFMIEKRELANKIVEIMDKL
ncbi:hypothetical protein HQ584_11080 [Patescibacteria group bacterium]|nr:hypothetical protein [Patescibacteria group bacterium]